MPDPVAFGGISMPSKVESYGSLQQDLLGGAYVLFHFLLGKIIPFRLYNMFGKVSNHQLVESHYLKMMNAT